MCIFSEDDGHPIEVKTTQIFARGDGPRQRLAYAMRLTTTREVAMILPLPVAPNSGEQAVEFVDLSGHATLFGDLAECFRPDEDDDDLMCLGGDDDGPNLQVHTVGSFVASYVPRLADFARLDPRFRLPEQIWQRLPDYGDWGFAVIQLQPGAQSVHPIALSFPRRWPDRLFFPTVHVHDGEVHETAQFAHVLYFQGPPRPVRRGAESQRAGRVEALRPPSTRTLTLSRGLVAPDLPLTRLFVSGERPNEDIWLLTPGA